MGVMQIGRIAQDDPGVSLQPTESLRTALHMFSLWLCKIMTVIVAADVLCVFNLIDDENVKICWKK